FVVFGSGDDLHLAHQRLDVGALHETIGQFAQADAFRDDAAGHRELHAELGGEPGVRLVVAQNGREIIADVDGDLLHVVRLDRSGVDKVEHAVDGAVGAVAGGILLDAETLGQDGPGLARLRLAGAVFGAGRRDRVQEALWVLQRIHAGGETGFRKTRGHDAGVRRLVRVERLVHRTEIRHQARALRRAQRDRLRRLVGV